MKCLQYYFTNSSIIIEKWVPKNLQSMGLAYHNSRGNGGQCLGHCHCPNSNMVWSFHKADIEEELVCFTSANMLWVLQVTYIGADIRICLSISLPI
jgi:hypothetical protein